MKLTVTAFMKSHLDSIDLEVKNENMPQVLENLKRFAGANAGICYMSKPYFDSYVTDADKALNRFVTVANTGHHSIAGHSQVSILIEGIPKILAMFLNNLNDYETSEKSGRYTVMTGNTEEEVSIYTKWCEKLKGIITDKYGDKIDEKTVDKLAKENARYFLSIFTPTTMSYTTSIRQFNYIKDWAFWFTACKDIPDNYFFNELKKYFLDFGVQLNTLIHIDELYEIKNRNTFDMIDYKNTDKVVPQYGRMYTVGYYGSFAQYAQAQRHRTLFYNMQFDGVSKQFFVPKIIRNTEYEQEWLEDMQVVAKYVPTGTMVYIEESGKIEYFFLKSMERNCGRAQLEIMEQNIETAKEFYSHKDEFPQRYQKIFDKYYFNNGQPKMKGQLLVCKEPCVWGCENAISREI